MRLPTLFINHGGGPCFFMDTTDMGGPNAWDKMAAFLRGIPALVGDRPRALLIVSAHWEEPAFTVTLNEKPGLLYDYYGFPKHTYELKYPAPGSRELAEKIAVFLKNAGLPAESDNARGFDHGVFIPMLLSFPNAEVPIVQLSLRKGLQPSEHIKAGQALQSLRDEGVLIIGSGMSYHNLKSIFSGSGLNGASGDSFDRWLRHAVIQPDSERRTFLENWAKAPGAREAHPREEHLAPLFVVAGAAGSDVGKVVYTDRVMNVPVSAFSFGKSNAAD